MYLFSRCLLPILFIRNQQQEEGGSKNAGLELLWTHRYPSGGGDHNPVSGNGNTTANGNGGGAGTQASAGGAAAATGLRSQAANRAPRSGGGEAGGLGGLSGGGGGGNGGVVGDEGLRDRTVTALCFHQLNGDVLAVGYGAFFFSPSVHKGGAVLFWSVRGFWILFVVFVLFLGREDGGRREGGREGDVNTSYFVNTHSLLSGRGMRGGDRNKRGVGFGKEYQQGIS